MCGEDGCRIGILYLVARASRVDRDFTFDIEKNVKTPRFKVEQTEKGRFNIFI